MCVSLRIERGKSDKLGCSREMEWGNGVVVRIHTIDVMHKEGDPNTNKNHVIQNNTLKSNTWSLGITVLTQINVDHVEYLCV